MRIQPRSQILHVWASMLAHCYHDGEWLWGGQAGTNSIGDAEQLLCILYPATQIESFALHDPDRIADDVRDVLSPLGRRIGPRIIQILDDYLQRYERDGQPIFSADSYLQHAQEDQPVPEQRALDVVDSYSMSLTLCLAGLQFVREFRSVRNRRTEKRMETALTLVQERLARRLTAAMVGLIRSFVVRFVDPDSEDGRAMLSMFNQTGEETGAVVAAVARKLERVRTRLRDATLTRTSEDDEDELEDTGLLFECGWSWGLVRDAQEIGFVDIPLSTAEGYAAQRPYLYFTAVALDGINDLSRSSTRELDLLDEEQRRLAGALQLRWEIAQRFWSTMARFGTGRWPLEDIPWRTADGKESDYFSLSMSALLIQDLVSREASDDDLTRATPIFGELARRGRITSRLTKDDPARALHFPGVSLLLEGSDAVGDGPKLTWVVSDYAPTLLKRTLQAAQLSGTLATRDQLLELAQATMSHLERRAFTTGTAKGLWDDADRYFASESYDGERVSESSDSNDVPSWYFTERIIECLVVAAKAYQDPPLRSTLSSARSRDLLSEADHLLNQRFLDLNENDHTPNRQALERIELTLSRARACIEERPGTAHSLCSEALRELDELDHATSDAMRGE